MQLPETVEVEPGLDVQDLADRFEIFEALHTDLEIATPMSEADLEVVVDVVAISDGDEVVDLACGSGVLLRSLARRRAITGLGIDLSPWMIDRAARADTPAGAPLRWVLGDAKEQVSELGAFDVVACLGASWVWLGAPGTVRTLTEHTRPGGRIVFGDMLRRSGIKPAQAAATPSADEVIDHMSSLGVDHVETVVTSDASWDAYIGETLEAYRRWKAANVDGHRFDDDVAEWVEAQHRDRALLEWTVIVGRRR